MDGAIFKGRRTITKNKIDVTLDIAVLVILSSAMREQGVLPTEKATVAKDDTIGIYISRDRLRSNTVSIFERDVLSAKIAGAEICAV